jgi:hypothetical protein
LTDGALDERTALDWAERMLWRAIRRRFKDSDRAADQDAFDFRPEFRVVQVAEGCWWH